MTARRARDVIAEVDEYGGDINPKGWHPILGDEVANAVLHSLASAGLPEATLDGLIDGTLVAVPKHRIVFPRGSQLLLSVVNALAGSEPCAVKDILAKLNSAEVKATPKEIYNAVAYLNRKGKVNRVGYGRYQLAALKEPQHD